MTVSKTRWKQLVSEGRLLVLQGAEARFQLGQRAQEIEPVALGRPKEKGGTPPLIQYADDIDCPHSLLAKCRKVFNQWGGKAPTASWSVLEELGREDDPWLAYETVAATHGKVNILTVRTWREKATAGVRSTSPNEDKAEEAGELLENLPPEMVAEVLESLGSEAIAAAIVASPDFEVTIAEAVDEVDEKRTSDNDKKTKKDRPAAWRETQFRKIRKDLLTARQKLEAVTDTLATVMPLDADEREDIQEYVASVGLWLGAVDEQARAAGTDAEIRRMTEGR